MAFCLSQVKRPIDMPKNCAAILGSTCNVPRVANVWVCMLHDYAGSIDKFASALTADERERAQRFLQRRDFERFILGRTMIRLVCAGWSGVAPRSLNLRQTATGRPYLAREGQPSEHWIDFNIAHTEDCVLIAWSVDQLVGTDVEAIEFDCAVPFRLLAETAFSDDERSALAAVQPSDAALTFYRIWVRKEAILKAEGCGVSGDLRSFSVAMRKTEQIEWLDEVYYPGSARQWRIVDFAPVPGYVASVTMEYGPVLQHCVVTQGGCLDLSIVPAEFDISPRR